MENETMDFGLGEKPLEETTVGELENLCSKIAEQRNICDEASSKLKTENQNLDALEIRLMETLSALNKDNYKSNVGTFSITHRTSVRIPQGDDREAFFGYLKEIGAFDALITVNSKTLNGWYSKQFEAAKDSGNVMDFRVPGLGEPSISEHLSFRKS